MPPTSSPSTTAPDRSTSASSGSARQSTPIDGVDRRHDARDGGERGRPGVLATVEDELGDGQHADDERDRRDEPAGVLAHPRPGDAHVVGGVVVLDLCPRLVAQARAGATGLVRRLDELDLAHPAGHEAHATPRPHGRPAGGG